MQENTRTHSESIQFILNHLFALFFPLFYVFFFFRQDRVKKGKEEDIQATNWDIVKFVDRYGEEHFVSPAKAEEMQHAEEEAMMDMEMDGKLPAPKLPRLAKDPDYNAVQIVINWSVPADFSSLGSKSVDYAVLRWEKISQHDDHSDNWGQNGLSSKGHVEYISTKKKEDREEEEITEKKIKNKRARFIEVSNLLQDTEYKFFTSFVYNEATLKEHVENGGVLAPNDGNTVVGEGDVVGPLTIRTAQALLQCGNCGSTLNWGLEQCVHKACEGSEASMSAWNK